MNPVIVILGNPIDGCEFYGPFEDAEDANAFAEEHFPNDTWWLRVLTKEVT